MSDHKYRVYPDGEVFLEADVQPGSLEHRGDDFVLVLAPSHQMAVLVMQLSAKHPYIAVGPMAREWELLSAKVGATTVVARRANEAGIKVIQLFNRKEWFRFKLCVPACQEMLDVHARSQAIGEFLEWLCEEKEMSLATPHEHCADCYTMGRNTPEEFRRDAKELGWLCHGEELENGRFNSPQCGLRKNQMLSANYNVEKLLAEFFEIDLN